MRCVPCVIAYQANETDAARDAAVVYKGMSLCAQHFNTVRGHAADFDRYPLGGDA